MNLQSSIQKSEGSKSSRLRFKRFFRLFGYLGSPWKNQALAIKHYWAIYGGFKSLLTSPYFQMALALTAVTLWVAGIDKKAAETAASVLPNLLGFTVGALAIVLAFSSAPVFRTLAEAGKPQSYFMKLTASLIHFILVQVLALISAIVAKITEVQWIDNLCLFLLYYAVLVTFAAGMQLFLTAIIYNTRESMPAPGQDEGDREG